MEETPILIIGFHRDAMRWIQDTRQDPKKFRIISTVEQIYGYHKVKVKLLSRTRLLDDYAEIYDRLKVMEASQEVEYI